MRFQLGVGMPPDVDHEPVRVSRLPTVAQTLSDAALLQSAEDEEWALGLLLGGAAARGAVYCYGGTAERLEVEHVRPSD